MLRPSRRTEVPNLMKHTEAHTRHSEAPEEYVSVSGVLPRRFRALRAEYWIRTKGAKINHDTSVGSGVTPYLRPAGPIQKHVGRLQVAVDSFFAVQSGHASANISENAPGLLLRERLT